MGQSSISLSGSHEFWLSFPRRDPLLRQRQPLRLPRQWLHPAHPQQHCSRPGCQGCWVQFREEPPSAQRGAGGDQLIWAGTIRTAGVTVRVLLSRRCHAMLFRNRPPAAEEKHPELTGDGQAGSSSGSSPSLALPHHPLQPMRRDHQSPPAVQHPSRTQASSHQKGSSLVVCHRRCCPQPLPALPRGLREADRA